MRGFELGVDALDVQLTVQLTFLLLSLDGAPLLPQQIMQAVADAKAKVLSQVKG